MKQRKRGRGRRSERERLVQHRRRRCTELSLDCSVDVSWSGKRGRTARWIHEGREMASFRSPESRRYSIHRFFSLASVRYARPMRGIFTAGNFCQWRSRGKRPPKPREAVGDQL